MNVANLTQSRGGAYSLATVLRQRAIDCMTSNVQESSLVVMFGSMKGYEKAQEEKRYVELDCASGDEPTPCSF